MIVNNLYYDFRNNKDICWQLQGWIKKTFLSIGLSLATLQESGNFSEVIERLHKSLICFALSFRKCQDRLWTPAAFETWFAFKMFGI